jgi:protocatechuate 3,4-dioxygenase beta subunit
VHQLWAEQDEGPYRRSPQPVRRDIVEDRQGTELQLGVRLGRSDGSPMEETAVEVWHCDALGRYSGFPAPGSSSAGVPSVAYLADQTFLRGSQRTDQAGMVEFRTIYPGWYPGRTVHIHLIVHVDDAALTSQLYFPDHVSDQVLAVDPYASHAGRDTSNASDEIFPTGGDPAVLDLHLTDGGYQGAASLVVPTG